MVKVTVKGGLITIDTILVRAIKTNTNVAKIALTKTKTKTKNSLTNNFTRLTKITKKITIT